MIGPTLGTLLVLSQLVGGALLHVQVMEGAYPIPGATVSVVSAAGATQQTNTDENGSARFVLAPGTYSAVALLEGFESRELHVTLSTGEMVAVTVRLEFDGPGVVCLDCDGFQDPQIDFSSNTTARIFSTFELEHFPIP